MWTIEKKDKEQYYNQAKKMQESIAHAKKTNVIAVIQYHAKPKSNGRPVTTTSYQVSRIFHKYDIGQGWANSS